MEHQQNHTFSADTGKLLKLMIHSLYSNKEIFLRELVSNAADAADKLRFKALSDGSLFENDADLRVRLSFDAGLKTITISDNGIGMTRDEVIEHLGTIAKSGTGEFAEMLKKASEQGFAARVTQCKYHPRSTCCSMRQPSAASSSCWMRDRCVSAASSAPSMPNSRYLARRPTEWMRALHASACKRGLTGQRSSRLCMSIRRIC